VKVSVSDAYTGRILSKALIARLVKPSEKDDSFSVMLKKYHDGDRTVFLVTGPPAA